MAIPGLVEQGRATVAPTWINVDVMAEVLAEEVTDGSRMGSTTAA